MKLETVDQYARLKLQPHVMSVLHKLHEHYTCGRTWTMREGGFFSPKTIEAAPLERELWRPPQLMAYAGANTALGEYTAYVSSEDFGVRARSACGRVCLQTSLSVRLDVTNGTDARLPGDDSLPGFLCWAERHTLSDQTEAYRLQVGLGAVWLRPAQAHCDRTLWQLLDEHEPPRQSKAEVVLIAASKYHVPQRRDHGLSGPWTDYETRDESGRKWVIEDSSMTFYASLEFKVQRRYNDKLRKLPKTVLEPPYEAVWRWTDDESDIALPLTLTAPL
jgi:hypothetical protein